MSTIWAIEYARTGCGRSVSDVIEAEIAEKGGFASTRKASLYQMVLGGIYEGRMNV